MNTEMVPATAPTNGLHPTLLETLRDAETARRWIDQHVTVEIVTPEIAAHWLTFNHKNRVLDERDSQALAMDMAAGDWRWTAEPVRFDRAGRLLDGQHRLRAIVIADATIPCLVVRGLEPESQEDTDTGRSRKFSDVLTMRDEVNTGQLASIVRLVYAWEDGRRRSLSGGAKATHAGLSRTLAAYPELRDIATRSTTLARHCPLPASLIGLSIWLFDRIDEEDSEFFFSRLADVQGLVKGDPIYELRRTLEANRNNVKGDHNRVYLMAIVIKAWNAYRRGEQVGLYRWKPGGAKPEAFPEPQ